jgi:hypothetical protein
VKALAVSATKTYGAFNYAAEFGAHFHQNLVSDGGTDASVASFGYLPKPDAIQARTTKGTSVAYWS